MIKAGNNKQHGGGVMVASWWRHGGVMVALVYAPKPEYTMSRI